MIKPAVDATISKRWQGLLLIMLMTCLSCKSVDHLNAYYNGQQGSGKTLYENLVLYPDLCYTYSISIYDHGAYSYRYEYIGNYKLSKRRIEFTLDSINHRTSGFRLERKTRSKASPFKGSYRLSDGEFTFVLDTVPASESISLLPRDTIYKPSVVKEKVVAVGADERERFYKGHLFLKPMYQTTDRHKVLIDQGAEAFKWTGEITWRK